MLVIFLDGESKSGKTAVGRSILSALQAKGYNVRLLVAGNFFRQLTALVLERLPNAAESDQTTFEAEAHAVLGSEALLRPPQDLALLETPAVESLVSRIGQLSFVQEAAAIWRRSSAEQAFDDQVEILLFDGRNLRQKLRGWADQTQVKVALELVIYCRPEVAAARYLHDERVEDPSGDELAKATEVIKQRRQNDRTRTQAAYVEPNDPVPLVVGTHSVDTALAAAWGTDVANPPRPIRFDNSEVPRDDGLRTVTELAEKAVDFTFRR